MSNEYFPHDYGARLSLRAVRKDYGLQGVGFYWCFVEILHEEDGYIKESDIVNIAYDLQVDAEMCEAIIRNYDLFTIKKGKIFSDRVLRNIHRQPAPAAWLLFSALQGFAATAADSHPGSRRCTR